MALSSSDSIPVVPRLLGGAAFFIIGVLLVIFRRHIHAWVVHAEAAMFGTRVRPLAKRQPVWSITLVGVFGIVVGAIALVVTVIAFVGT